MKRTFAHHCAGVAVAAAGLCGTALAQPGTGIAAPRTETAQAGQSAPRTSGSTIQPPRPSELKRTSPLLNYGVLVVLAGAVIVLSIMPSKRGHQD